MSRMPRFCHDSYFYIYDLSVGVADQNIKDQKLATPSEADPFLNGNKIIRRQG
jgi:hypothetical protein